MNVPINLVYTQFPGWRSVKFSVPTTTSRRFSTTTRTWRHRQLGGRKKSQLPKRKPLVVRTAAVQKENAARVTRIWGHGGLSKVLAMHHRKSCNKVTMMAVTISQSMSQWNLVKLRRPWDVLPNAFRLRAFSRWISKCCAKSQFHRRSLLFHQFHNFSVFLGPARVKTHFATFWSCRTTPSTRLSSTKLTPWRRRKRLFSKNWACRTSRFSKFWRTRKTATKRSRKSCKPPNLSDLCDRVCGKISFEFPISHNFSTSSSSSLKLLTFSSRNQNQRFEEEFRKKGDLLCRLIDRVQLLKWVDILRLEAKTNFPSEIACRLKRTTIYSIRTKILRQRRC